MSLGLCFENGHWIWDDDACMLNYDKTTTLEEGGIDTKASSRNLQETVMTFNDNITALEVVNFRRIYQRRVKFGDPEIITLQDIKDVVLFTADPTKLTLEFLVYFHLPTVDRLLRALLVYFDYFIKVNDYMMYKRSRMDRKLRHAGTAAIEQRIANEVADRRAMVGREYGNIILGAGDCATYHHLSDRNGTSKVDKDARLTEMLICMCARVVWLAMEKKNHILIEVETHRLFRSSYFNIVANRLRATGRKVPEFNPDEKHIMHGESSQHRTLLQRSPAVTELMNPHDFRLLGCGVMHVEHLSQRLQLLTWMYTLPETKLVPKGLVIGILGQERSDFDPVLNRLTAEQKQGDLAALMNYEWQESEESAVEEEHKIEEATIVSTESSLGYLSGYGKTITLEMFGLPPIKRPCIADDDVPTKIEPIHEIDEIESFESEEEGEVTPDEVQMPPMPAQFLECLCDKPSHDFTLPTIDNYIFQVPESMPKARSISEMSTTTKRQMKLWMERVRQAQSADTDII